jgi:drug/metabolite transporter (DMT)-like permease
MAIALGLLSAFCFALADLVARSSIQKLGVNRTLFYMQLVGLCGLTLYLGLTGQMAIFEKLLHWQLLLPALLSALATIIGYLFLYRAFAIGKLSIVSPIASSYAALTVILSVIAGEHLRLVQFLGMAVVLAGVVLVSIRQPVNAESKIDDNQLMHSTGILSAGVVFAVIAAACFGVAFWLLGFAVTPQLGEILPIWLYRLVGVIVLVPLSIRTKQSLSLPGGRLLLLLVFVGVLDAGAFVFSAWGFTTGEIALVSVVSSLYSAVTVMLAWVFLRERLRPMQWAAILLLLIGIVITQL